MTLESSEFYERKSGVLLHPTSLPGPYGIGDLGPEAYRFVDRLAAAGQRLWQVLPLGPTGMGHSPYQSPSSFAGNINLISPELLMNDGLLTGDELEVPPGLSDSKVNFDVAIPFKEALLEKVSETFSRRASSELKNAYEVFCNEQAYWLEDYALFMAQRNQTGGKPWYEWPRALVTQKPSVMDALRAKLAADIEKVRIQQFLFDSQWHRLRRYASEQQVAIVGDLPIFTALDSADVWGRRDLFWLKRNGRPSKVAGVPPDYFSATGQLWGNPLYRWRRHVREGFTWWISRLGRVFDLVDVVRIDHFRGFAACWEIPAHHETAMNGKWAKAPGAKLLQAIREHFGTLPVIAEDLGVITPDVEALRDRFELPGMRILQFAFCDPDTPSLLPENYPGNSICYTGTHDNDTICGWFNEQPGEGLRSADEIERDRNMALKYTADFSGDIHWDMIQLAMETRSHTAVFPLQDVLGLGSEARMNVPGTVGDNWNWRFAWSQWPEADDDRLAELVQMTGRGY